MRSRRRRAARAAAHRPGRFTRVHCVPDFCTSQHGPDATPASGLERKGPIMTKRYSVLRDLSRITTREPFAAGRDSFGLEALRAAQVVPHVEARDLEVAAIAPIMPTRLIEPLAAAAAAPPTWGVSAVRADVSAFTGNGVVPCVLDTGIDSSHPAFHGVQLVERDFTGEGTGDGHGHGTHCAGTIFGRDVGGTRIGVAPGVRKALIGKVLDSRGSGTSAMIFDGI